MTNKQHSPNIAIGSRIRKSPYYESTKRCGVKAFSIYNRMFMPTLYTSVVEEYWSMINDVVMIDVACERQIEINGPDAHRLVQFLTPRDVSNCDIGRCYYILLTGEDGGIINVEDIVKDILGYVKKSEAKRLAIDPIAPLIFSDQLFENVVEYIRTLIFSIENNTDCTTLLTSYIPVGSEKVSCFGIEEFAASGIIVLKLATVNHKRIRTIGIRKMRATKIDLTEYSFEILSERGITLRQPI